ncbi:F0F1 ATP synthase subunit gamma [Hirschia maritima]|uniref:F0F1 ATP synthase subunit gamma n=1 Tax=Hirschia maritima TaxID=1121961 RepID=UPI0003693B42|nr:F0F1 ATP synthase subunit gamma [Hirschia maritima]
MASLKDLRARIASVKSTQKITKAMQMVAAAKLKRAQEAAESARPYAQRMAAVIGNLADSVGVGEGGPRLLAGTGNDQTHLVVVLTAERGLCGGFNGNVAKLARTKITTLQAEGKDVKLLTIGKKGNDALKREFGAIIVDHIDLRGEKELNGDVAGRIGRQITDMFDDGAFDICSFIYAEFKNVLSQKPVSQQLIPAVAPEDAPKVDLAGATYLYEPSETDILEALLPRYLNTQILSALLESSAGEQGARMTAMDNATRNAGEMIDSLNLTYNRARQAQITTELTEIISGAEAL